MYFLRYVIRVAIINLIITATENYPYVINISLIEIKNSANANVLLSDDLNQSTL